MGYVGNQTTTAFTSMDKQDITGDGTPNYTLSHAVANSNEIEVFVNNVRQEPSVAYSASGTTLTMTGNVASTDDFYVVYQGKSVGTIVPPDGSVSTAKIADDAVTSAKLDTNIAINGNLDVGSIRATNGTAAVTIDDSGRVLQPAKPAFRGAIEVIASANYTTETQITNYTESFDIGGNFNHTTGIFTAPVDGLYQINFMISGGGAQGASNLYGKLYINGAELIRSRTDPQGGTSFSLNYSSVLNLTSGDELKVQLLVDADTSISIDDIDFSGYLVA
jgi:hypothetical protein